MQCTPQKSTNRNHTIDFIKGVCIIFIIITHFDWTEEERLQFLFPFWIDMAVPIFMAISGYVYSKSYINRNINSIADAYTYKNIYNKIIRYTVPYMIAYLIELILFALRGDLNEMSPIIFSFIDGGEGPGSYYYPIMIQLVFSFPVIFFTIRKYDLKGLIGCWCANGVYEILQRAYELNGSTYRLLVYRYIFIIALGCYLAIGTKPLKRAKTIIISAIGIVYIAAYCYFHYDPQIIIYWTRTSFIAVMYIVPIVPVLFRAKIKCKPVELLGKASYNIFLTQMVYYAITDELSNTLIENVPLRVLFNISLCTIIGTIFYLLEDPVTKKIIKELSRN